MAFRPVFWWVNKSLWDTWPLLKSLDHQEIQQKNHVPLFFSLFFFLSPASFNSRSANLDAFPVHRCALAMQVTWSITGWQWCVFSRCCSFFWWRADLCKKIYRRFLWHVLLQLFLWDCCVPQSMSKMDFLYWSIFLPDSLSHTTHNALPSFKATAIKHHHTTTTNT